MSNFVMTLNRHIIEQERKYPRATGEFTALLTDIALAAKIVSYNVNKAGLVNILGSAGAINVHGESQKKLDVLANEIMLKSLYPGGKLCALGSEEEPDLIPIPEEFPLGKYVCVFDPLDGSSNIEANVSIGTIFGIYIRVSPGGRPGKMEDLLQPGYKQVCAGYVIYGSSTMLVYTSGSG
ncbi:MAG TPA: fructose-1,6-bisphosphatase, partial [Caldithrix sp.]|nr:fructose-1,6-bisphosphatase [Caldithrix sp.]